MRTGRDDGRLGPDGDEKEKELELGRLGEDEAEEEANRGGGRRVPAVGDWKAGGDVGDDDSGGGRRGACCSCCGCGCCCCAEPGGGDKGDGDELNGEAATASPAATVRGEGVGAVCRRTGGGRGRVASDSEEGGGENDDRTPASGGREEVETEEDLLPCAVRRGMRSSRERGRRSRGAAAAVSVPLALDAVGRADVCLSLAVRVLHLRLHPWCAAAAAMTW